MVNIEYYSQGGYFPYQAEGCINNQYNFYLRFRRNTLEIEFFKKQQSQNYLDWKQEDLDKQFYKENVSKGFPIETRSEFPFFILLKEPTYYIGMEDHNKCTKILKKVFKKLYEQEKMD